MKKVILKLVVHDNNAKKEIERAASSISGINSYLLDMEAKELTVTGEVNELDILQRLDRWSPEILKVEPAKEPEDKKKEPGSSH